MSVGSAHPSVRAHPSQRRRRVLVIEDEQATAEALAYLLNRDGFVVDWAPSGLLGLSLFDQCRPDLVLLDLMMPVMDGLEVCRALRRRSSAPIIMVTARGSDEDRDLGLAAGADDYVVKPYTLADLHNRISAALNPPDDRAGVIDLREVDHVGGAASQAPPASAGGQPRRRRAVGVWRALHRRHRT